ncbi:cytochrome c [bacterium]|nr:cytochrome c [bacterium]
MKQKNRFQLPSGALKKNISTGQQIYEKNCASCHGIEGQGKIGPRLRARLIPKDSFFNVIAQGRNSMPAFRETLDGDQLEALWSFLQRPLTSENN